MNEWGTALVAGVALGISLLGYLSQREGYVWGGSIVVVLAICSHWTHRSDLDYLIEILRAVAPIDASLSWGRSPSGEDGWVIRELDSGQLWITNTNFRAFGDAAEVPVRLYVPTNWEGIVAIEGEGEVVLVRGMKYRNA